MLSLIVLSQTLKPAPTKLGDFLGQTLLTAPTKLGDFLGQTLLTDPTKVWETPLNFDDPIYIAMFPTILHFICGISIILSSLSLLISSPIGFPGANASILIA